MNDLEKRAAVLRAARGWSGEDQAVVAAGAGITGPTLRDAEKARRCSDKSWAALLGYYDRAHGLALAVPDGGEPRAVIVVR